MKKLLLILPAILLLSTSCSFDNKSVELEKQNQNLQAQLAMQQQKDIFDLQEKCSNSAERYFNSSGLTGYGYINHYNKKLNKCFIKIYNTTDGQVITLYDIQDNTLYATFGGFNDHNDYTKLIVTICNVTQTKCTSLEQFNSSISSYLND